MSETPPNTGKWILSPMDRISEVLFGLIMVLTITCSFSIGGAGRADVREMLIGALGCNLAWGMIDATMYLMSRFSEHGHNIQALRALRATLSPERAHRIIAHNMPALLASVISPHQFEEMRQKLEQIPGVPPRPQLTKEDWLASLGVFLLVLAATFPVLLPFIFMKDAYRALRTSNAIAIAMLFIMGYAFGRYAGHRPMAMGAAMVIAGSAMVGITIALGG